MKRKDFSKLKLEVQTEKEQYFEQEEFIAGVPPFLRGISTTMYLQHSIKTISAIENDLVETNSEKLIEKKLSNDTVISLSVKEITPEIELSSLLKKASTIFKIGHSLGFSTDLIASKIAFNLQSKNDTFTEIATMRAARFLWANFVKQLSPKNPESLALQISIDSKNDYSKTVTAIFGGVQNVVSTAETIRFIENETLITKTVDPFAGSTILEQLTENIILKSSNLFQLTA